MPKTTFGGTRMPNRDDTTAGSGSASKTTAYEYDHGHNWRRDVGEFSLDKHRTWSVFRGYGTVRTLTGASNRTKTETSYFRRAGREVGVSHDLGQLGKAGRHGGRHS
ncbi:hypothetical protein ACIHCQ_13055 [Streptomyces sp. NPDC052236]|uniref:hypothetical protein n=1 Tax=Streptomyces sp. NPDC052236 TaxID=3365686 RepID=UPI0037D02176